MHTCPFDGDVCCLSKGERELGMCANCYRNAGLPKYETEICYICNGTGQMDEHRTCPNCLGTGKED